MYPGGYFVVEMMDNWLHNKEYFAVGNQLPTFQGN
jgi:hypothetical protein